MAVMVKAPSKISVREFIASVGREEFQADLGHTTQVVTRAIADGKMPAHWYVEVRDWAKARGHSAPEYLFKWSRKSPDPSTQNANSGPRVQGQTRQKVNASTVGGAV